MSGRWVVGDGVVAVAALLWAGAACSSNQDGGGQRASSQADAAPDGEADTQPPAPEVFENPYPNPALPRWCKGATHLHTTASDGVDTLDAMIAAYVSHGYDFMFVTDHDLRTVPQTPQVIQVFPGEEVTTDWGHANAFGISTQLPKFELQQDAIDATTAAGGLMQRNHPGRRDNTTLEKLSSWQGLWGLEVHNELNWAEADRGLWDSQLSQGKRLWGTFGDDAHDVGVAGRGWIMVNTTDTSCSLPAVLDAMRAGAFYMSEGPNLTLTTQGDTVHVSTDAAGAVIEWYAQGLMLLRHTEAASDDYTLSGSEAFVRVEITDSAGRHTWSQPLFVHR